jgi:hypothetical protein
VVVRCVWNFRHVSLGKAGGFPFKLSANGADISKRIVLRTAAAQGRLVNTDLVTFVPFQDPLPVKGADLPVCPPPPPLPPSS